MATFWDSQAVKCAPQVLTAQILGTLRAISARLARIKTRKVRALAKTVRLAHFLPLEVNCVSAAPRATSVPTARKLRAKKVLLQMALDHADLATLALSALALRTDDHAPRASTKTRVAKHSARHAHVESIKTSREAHRAKVALQENSALEVVREGSLVGARLYSVLQTQPL